jgi:SAM-dependent methyltransferase
MQSTVLPQTYVFGSSSLETQRLRTLAQLVMPSTVQMMKEAGITKGMTVLDVGCGAGDVSLLLAQQVGSEGEVLGVDSNSEILETARARAQAAGLTNVSFIQGNIAELALETQFDAVVGRLILQHMHDPVSVLSTLAGHVKPGGIVAFQEADLTRLGDSSPFSPLFAQVGDWCRTAMMHAGLDPQMGLGLLHVFLEAGLAEPQVQCTSFIGGGADWPWYDMIAERVRSLLPVLLRDNIATAEEIAIDTLAQRCRDEMVDLRGVAMATDFISCWTRVGCIGGRI